MLQYKIPQNVGIEDKIVGPFSLRQLIILGVGFGISYTIFALTSRVYELNILEYIIIAIPGLLALAAAVIKIHNVTFTKFILLSLEYAINPKKRYWNHHGIASTVDPDLTDKIKKEKKDSKETEEKRKNVNLSELSATLDSGGFIHLDEVKHEDLDQVNDDDLITQAYFGHRRKEGVAHNMYWRTRDVQKKKLDILAKMPSVKVAKETEKITETKSDLPDLVMPIKATKPDQITKVIELKEEKPATTPKAAETITIEKPTLQTKNLSLSSNLKEIKFTILNSRNEEVGNEETSRVLTHEGRHIFTLKLSQGAYLIKFKDVEDYKVPEDKNVVLNEQDEVVKIEYLPLETVKEVVVEEIPYKESVKAETKEDALPLPQKPDKTQKIVTIPEATPPKKKKRRRNRKKKQPLIETSESTYQEVPQTQSESIKVEQKVKEKPQNQSQKKPLITKSKVEAPIKPINKKEVTLKDLQAGEEIEFNLD